MNYKYDVFISYKHAALDMQVSSQLQKMLEHYHVPKEIRKKGKEKLSRVFRDKEELSAGINLDNEIRDQLAQSEFLVVVCSPDSAASVWVQKEVSTFIELHGGERIIPLLIAGEPDEAFPEPLKQLGEPLAVDIRAVSSGGEREVLKRLKRELPRLVAPVLHCSYDELKQRGKAYRYKRIMIASLAALSVVLAFLAYAAVQYARLQESNRELEYSRSQALTAQAETALQDNDPVQAAVYALEALNNGDLEDTNYDPGAQLVLSEATACYVTEEDSSGYLRAIRKIDLPETVDNDCFCTSADRSLLLAASDRNLYVYQVSDGQLLWTIPLHKDSTYSNYISQVTRNQLIGDSEIVFLESFSILCVNYRTGEEAWKLSMPSDADAWVLSEDQSQLFVLEDNRFYTIATATGKIISSIPVQIPSEYGIELRFENGAISPDGKYLYATNENDEFILADIRNQTYTVISVSEEDNADVFFFWVEGSTGVFLEREWQQSESTSMCSWTVSVYDAEKQDIIWTTSDFETSSVYAYGAQCVEPEGKEGDLCCLLNLGSCFYLLDVSNHEICADYDLGSEVKWSESTGTCFYAVTADGAMYQGQYESGVLATAVNSFSNGYGGTALGCSTEKYIFLHTEDSSETRTLYFYGVGVYDENVHSAGNLTTDSWNTYSVLYDNGIVSWDRDTLTLTFLDQTQERTPDTVTLCDPSTASSWGYQFLDLYEGSVRILDEENGNLYLVDTDTREVQCIDAAALTGTEGTNLTVSGHMIWAYYVGDDSSFFAAADYETGNVITFDIPDLSWANGIFPSPDGTMAVIFDYYDLWMYLADSNGKIISKTDLSDWNRDDVGDPDIVWSSDGSLFAAIRQTSVEIYNQKGELISEISPTQVDGTLADSADLFFSGDGQWLYLAEREQLRRYSVQDGQEETLSLPETMIIDASSEISYQETTDGRLVLCDRSYAVVIQSDADNFCIVDYVPGCTFYDSENQRFYRETLEYTDDALVYNFWYYPQYTLQEQIQKGKLLTGTAEEEDDYEP